MMDDHPVAHLEVLHPWAHLDDPAAGFMTHSPELRRVSPFIPWCPESPEVASAEPGSAHFNDDFRGTRFGFGEIPYFQMPLAQKNNTFHESLLSPTCKIRQIASESISFRGSLDCIPRLKTGRCHTQGIVITDKQRKPSPPANGRGSPPG
jgi:hypothetical protein